MTERHHAKLEWLVKSSFVAYVEALPDGVIAISGGVTRAADGVFAFPATTDETPGRHSYTGSIHFRGHHGVLDFALADPAIETSGHSVELTTAVGSERVRFATVGELVSRPDGSLTGERVALTDDGAYLLGGVYQPGTPLEPFTLHGVAE